MTNSLSSSDDRLDAIVAEYYEARDAGQPVTADELAARHPELASQIRQFIGDIENVAAVLQHRPGGAGLDETVAPSGGQTAVIHAGSVVRYFGDYEILGELGRGGMGVVYQARQRKLKRVVALKMIKVGQLASESETLRFEAEARAAARLSHPGIVAVHEVGTHDGQHFYSMDFVAGGSLAGLARDEPVAARRAAELVKQLAEAVQYAHEQGVVHRDLKPANVLLTSGGAPRITDFGLAKRLWTEGDSEAVSMTESGQIIGTAGYMSPEQAAGKTRLVGPPADIYALGAILYALLTSRAPFVGESQADTILQVIQKDPVPPRTLNPSTPHDLETICLKCLEKEPHKRYGTAQLLANDLQRFLENRPVLARPISGPARAWRWCRRNPWAATALALLVILGVGSPPVAYQYYKHAQEIDEQKGKIAGLLTTETVLRTKAQDDAINIGKQKTEIEGLLQTKEEALGRAKKAEGDAKTAQSLAEQEAAAKSQTLYISDMKRMEVLWREANLRTMRALLARHIPAPGKPDLREFEWHYWNRQCNRERRQWKHGQSVTHLALSTDGQWMASAAMIDDSHCTIQIVNLETGLVERTSAAIADSLQTIQFTDGDRSLLIFQQFAQRPQEWKWTEADELTPAAAVRKAENVPRTLWRLSEDGAFVARSMMNFVSCLHRPRFEGLKIRIGSDPAELAQWRKKNHVIHRDSESHYVEFQAVVPGVIRIRTSEVISDSPSDPEFSNRFPIRSWNPADELAPPEEEDGGPVFSLAFSPNKDRLAAGSRHGELFVWDLASGSELKRLAAHDSIIWEIAFSPDSTLFATASKDGAVKVWRTKDGGLVTSLAGHEGGARSLKFLGNRYLVSGGDDCCVRVWSSVSGAQLAVFQGHEQEVIQVAALNEGNSIYSASRDGTIREWSLTGQDEPIVIADRMPIESIAIFPDGSRVAGTGLTNDVTIWDTGSGRIQATLRGQFDYSFHVSVASDGNTIAAGSWDGTFTRWDAHTGKLLTQRKLPILINQTGMPAASISPDARRAAACCPDGKVRVFDLETRDVVATFESDLIPIRVVYSPNGDQVLTAAISPEDRGLVNRPITMQLWDAYTGELATVIAERIGHVVAFAPNGRSIAVSRRVDPDDKDRLDLEIVVISLPGQEVTARLPVPEVVNNVNALAISPDGLWLAAVGGASRTKDSQPAKPALLIYDLTTAALQHHWQDDGNQVLFTPDSRDVMIAAADGRVRVWSLAEGKPVSELTRSAGPVVSAVWSRKERKLAVVGHSGERPGFMQSMTRVAQSIVSLQQPILQEQRITRTPVGPTKSNFIGLADGSFADPGSLPSKMGLNAATLGQFKFTGWPRGALEAYSEQVNCGFLTAPTGALIRGSLDGKGEAKFAEQAIPKGQTCLALAASVDGRLVALAYGDHLELWDGEILERQYELAPHEGFVRALAFSPDGSRLASGGADRTVRIWNTVDGSLVATCLGHKDLITSLSFAKTGRTVASASRDGTIELWDVASGESKTTLMGHVGPVHWLEFSPDGTELVSAGEDGTVRIWNGPGWTEVNPFLDSDSAEEQSP